MPRVMTPKQKPTVAEVQCTKCKRGGGTLQKFEEPDGSKYYKHVHCLPPSRYAIPRKLRRQGVSK